MFITKLLYRIYLISILLIYIKNLKLNFFNVKQILNNIDFIKKFR